MKEGSRQNEDWDEILQVRYKEGQDSYAFLQALRPIIRAGLI